MLPTLLLSAFAWAVPAPTDTDFYTLFYVLAFALNLGLLVREGHRRGYPLRSWLVLLACTTLAFILGTKLLQRIVNIGGWIDRDSSVWVSYMVFGGILVLVGLFCMHKRESPDDAKASK